MLEDCNFTFGREKDAKLFREIAPEVKTLQAYIKSKEDLEHTIQTLKPNIIVTWPDSVTPEVVDKDHKRNSHGWACVV